jgi:hypothetical protein
MTIQRYVEIVGVFSEPICARVLTVLSYCLNLQSVSEAATADKSGVPEPPPTLASQGARGSRDKDDGETREIS